MSSRIEKTAIGVEDRVFSVEEVARPAELDGIDDAEAPHETPRRQRLTPRSPSPAPVVTLDGTGGMG